MGKANGWVEIFVLKLSMLIDFFRWVSMRLRDSDETQKRLKRDSESLWKSSDKS